MHRSLPITDFLRIHGHRIAAAARVRSLMAALCFGSLPFTGHCQTAIINEVSNGPSGNMEYMELVVIPDGPIDPCTPQPCMDLRGWMIDDNNGYHGAGGVAPGAVRFADHALWSCVPLGTLILLYNGGDPNTSLPADDIDQNDGNCSLVLSAMDLTYFEYTNATPGAVPCDMPGGWGTDPSPTWVSNMAFANSGDCARLTDATGCEVFTFCYGNTTANATIAFAGQGGDKVWWFGSGDPYSAAAWSQGCAGDIAACGSDDQTPGAANSAANAAWIAQFNNGCAPVPLDPISASAIATDGCGCTGTANGSASGSTGPYGYIWYDDTWSSIGQPVANATGLCTGTYHVVVTSATGCADTASVVVNTIDPPNPGLDSDVVLCPSASPIDLFDQLGGSPVAGGTWSPALTIPGSFDPQIDTPGAFTYTVQGTAPCDDASAIISVIVQEAIAVVITSTDVTCAGGANGSISVAVDDPTDHQFQWSNGLPDGQDQQGLAQGEYEVVITDPVGCSEAFSIPINEPLPLVVTTSATSAMCGSATGSACADADQGTGPYAFLWNDPGAQSGACATDLLPGTFEVVVTDAEGCTTTASVIVPDEPLAIDITPTVMDVSCHGADDGAISLAFDPTGTYTVAWTFPNGSGGTGATIAGLLAGSYAYTVVDQNGCSATGLVEVNGPDAPVLVIGTTAESCADACDGTATVQVTGGTAPWTMLFNNDAGPIAQLPELCAGVHDITVIDDAGCIVADQFEILPGEPVVEVSIAPVPALCGTADMVALVASVSGGTWSGVGITDAVEGWFDPVVAGTGVHNVQYILPGTCQSQGSIDVTVAEAPTAGFRFGELLNEGLLVIDQSIGADQLSWSVNGLPFPGNQDLLVPISTEDDDPAVCQVVTSFEGCTDTFCATYTIRQDPLVHVPNAFTPNDDGFNDLFQVIVHGDPAFFELIIFDRWGQVVFNTSDHAMAWKGDLDGTALPTGVYPWRLRWSDGSQDHVVHGHVVLLR